MLAACFFFFFFFQESTRWQKETVLSRGASQGCWGSPDCIFQHCVCTKNWLGGVTSSLQQNWKNPTWGLFLLSSSSILLGAQKGQAEQGHAWLNAFVVGSLQNKKGLGAGHIE